MKKIDFTQGYWINSPHHSKVTQDFVEIITEPNTDFWQRSYYGFRNDNAPALLVNLADNFTLTTQVEFTYQKQFDQCGVIIYLDSENWFKASIEYENEQFSRLGSVVTNFGYSDWATTDIATVNSIYYRLSRRGSDFLIESSFEGQIFKQMRIFHLHSLGETTQEMGQSNPPLPAKQSIALGLYACSPNLSSFKALFSDFILHDCTWMAHQTSHH